MQFGLVVTDDQHGDAAVALLEAAQARGWECRCFLSDQGALLLADPAFIGSSAFSTTQIAVCELSVERFEKQGLRVSAFSPHVVIGGQYQDAELVRKSDCVLVL